MSLSNHDPNTQDNPLTMLWAVSCTNYFLYTSLHRRKWASTHPLLSEAWNSCQRVYTFSIISAIWLEIKLLLWPSAQVQMNYSYTCLKLTQFILKNHHSGCTCVFPKAWSCLCDPCKDKFILLSLFLKDLQCCLSSILTNKAQLDHQKTKDNCGDW